MIDKITIDHIFEAADIVEVISEFVSLKKRGVNWIGLCPFHNEKTPSFTVSQAKGIFKCFGCGKGGNVVNFIMEHESLSYPEALKWLAVKYHIEISEKEETPEEKQKKDERESMMIVSSFAQKYFSDFLWKEEEGRTIGLSYFLQQRGLHENIIKKFNLGYCPKGKDKFTQEALRQGYKMNFLEKTGLTIKRDEWIRDRFAGRVIFPIQGLAGRIIGFGGRILINNDKTAKYLNSPESDIYHKSNALYGIYHAKRAITQKDKCFLVEGYLDVLSMHQSGIENVVASSGTSLTANQIRLIKRFTNNITILYDGDAAGIKASLRGIDMVLEEGINVKVLLLPKGEDPDSFAQSHSSSELEKYIENNETDFIKFKTKLLLKEAENDPIKKSGLITNIIKSIAVVPNNITRSVYIQECSHIMNVSEEILFNEVRRLKSRNSENIRIKNNRESAIAKQKLKPEQKKKQKRNNCDLLEQEIIRILLKYFNCVVFEEEDEDNPEIKTKVTVGQYIIGELDHDNLVSDNNIVNTILDIFRENINNDNFNSNSFFINHSDPQISQYASNIIAEKYTESKRWKKFGNVESEDKILDKLVPKIVLEYKLRKTRIFLESIEQKISEASKEKDLEQIKILQLKYIQLKKVEKNIALDLGTRPII